MSVSDVDLLRTLEEVTDPRESPVATPGDVADELPIGAEAVRQRLIRLSADDDGIQTRKVGRSRVFWTWGPVVGTDDVDDDPEGERADRGGDPSPTEQFDPTADADELLQEARDDDLRSEVLDSLDGSTVKSREAREALATLAVILDERGPMKTSPLRAKVYDRHRDDYSSEKGLWSSISPFFGDFEFIEDTGYGEWGPDRP